MSYQYTYRTFRTYAGTPLHWRQLERTRTVPGATDDPERSLQKRQLHTASGQSTVLRSQHPHPEIVPDVRDPQLPGLREAAELRRRPRALQTLHQRVGGQQNRAEDQEAAPEKRRRSEYVAGTGQRDILPQLVAVPLRHATHESAAIPRVTDGGG